jgi:ribosome assembly protein RRB1
MDVDESPDVSDGETGEAGESIEDKVYLPGQSLEEGEELVCDYSAYVMYHQAQTGAPCLSFDILPDDLGMKRETFPLQCYIVAGTQAERAHTNNIIVIKLSNLHKTQDDGSDDESDSEDEKPELEAAMIQHTGNLNFTLEIKCFYLLQRI